MGMGQDAQLSQNACISAMLIRRPRSMGEILVRIARPDFSAIRETVKTSDIPSERQVAIFILRRSTIPRSQDR